MLSLFVIERFMTQQRDVRAQTLPVHQNIHPANRTRVFNGEDDVKALRPV